MNKGASCLFALNRSKPEASCSFQQTFVSALAGRLWGQERAALRKNMDREGAVLGWLVRNQGNIHFSQEVPPGTCIWLWPTVLDSGHLAVVPTQGLSSKCA